MKSFFLTTIFLLSSAAFAAPEVNITSVVQDSDMSVKIAFTLTEAPAIVTFDIKTKAEGDEWVSFGRKNFLRLSGDTDRIVETKNGNIIWLCDHIGDAKKFAAGELKITLKAWALANPPDYMALDLTEGAAAGYARLRFYENAEAVPGGVLNPEYRLSTLLMRRCHAANVTWPMGSSEVRDERNANEVEHLVTLDEDYYLAVFPTTVAQSGLMGYLNGYYPIDRTMRIRDSSYHTAGHSPIRGESYWPDVPAESSMLWKLRQLVGGKIDFELPTEAQWEYAAHAGNYGGYWGNGKPYQVSAGQKNVDENLPGRYRFNQATDWMPSYVSTYYEQAQTIGVTNATPIAGSYAPNDWGFYDMNGGVWEWCLDWYQDDITGLGGKVNINPEDGTKRRDGTTPSDLHRVIRGGSWNSTANACRSEFRDSRKQVYAGDFSESGFRVAAPALIK